MVQRCVGHGAALGHTVAEGLLDEYIFSRLKGAHRGDCMPMIGRDDRYCIDLLDIEQPAKIAESLRLVPFLFFDQGDGPVEMPLVDIADSADANLGMQHEFLQAAGSLAAYADHSHDDLIVGIFGGPRRPIQRRQRSANSERADECSAGYFRWIHFGPLSPLINTAYRVYYRNP